MTDVATDDVGESRIETETAVSWILAIIVYVLLAVCVGAIAFVGMIAMIPVAFVLVFGAVPYTIVATILILRRRRSARISLDRMPHAPVATHLANFGGWLQKLSLLNGVMLGLIGMALLVFAVLPAGPADFSDNILLLLPLVAIFSLLEIILNAGWIYPKRTVIAEEYALRVRMRSWKVIQANRWLGWVIWYSGSAVAAYLLISRAFPLSP